jgi:hypothetical protein
VGAVPTSRQLSFDGRVLLRGVRLASACSEEPILGIAQNRYLTFVALSGVRLLISWRFHLPEVVHGPFVFGVPPMITGHLTSAPTDKPHTVTLVLRGNEVRLTTSDDAGPYELRWHFNPHRFPAPPGMSRLLALPPSLVRLNYLEISDAIHQAVARLVAIESGQRVHRTKLAILLGLSHGHLVVEGQEIRAQAVGEYYFDPRLIIRALEHVHAEQIDLGVTELSSRRAFLSIVDRQPDRLTHCALLSIGLDTQRLFPLPPRMRR